MSAAVVNSHRISIIWAPPSGPPARLQSDDPQDVARRLMDTVAAMTAVEFEEYWDSEPDDEAAKAKALASAVARGKRRACTPQKPIRRLLSGLWRSPLLLTYQRRRSCGLLRLSPSRGRGAEGIGGDGGFWENTIASGFRGNYPLYMGASAPKVASAAKSYQLPPR